VEKADVSSFEALRYDSSITSLPLNPKLAGCVAAASFKTAEFSLLPSMSDRGRMSFSIEVAESQRMVIGAATLNSGSAAAGICGVGEALG
jgi:hypothetical protein